MLRCLILQFLLFGPHSLSELGPQYIYFDTSASARHEVLPNASTWCFFTFSLCPQFSGFNAHTYVLTPSLPPLLAVLHPTHPSGGQPSPFLAVNSPPPPLQVVNLEPNCKGRGTGGRWETSDYIVGVWGHPVNVRSS